MNKIGRNLYHVVTPDETITFTTRQAARNSMKTWAPSQTLLFVTSLTSAQQIKANLILRESL